MDSSAVQNRPNPITGQINVKAVHRAPSPSLLSGVSRAQGYGGKVHPIAVAIIEGGWRWQLAEVAVAVAE